MWLEGSQSRKQVENGHLDQRVFTGPVFQHPPTHLEKDQTVNRDTAPISAKVWTGLHQLTSLCDKTLTKTDLVKSLLHQLPTVSTLYQRALGGSRCSSEGEEALRSAVAQQAQEGIGLLWLQ